MTKSISPVQLSKRNSSRIRVPNAGFVRSISVGSSRGRGGSASGSINGNASINGEYSKDHIIRRRDRSRTPEYKFQPKQQQQIQTKAKRGEKEAYRTRTRSKSPLPPHGNNNNNKNLSRQRQHLNDPNDGPSTPTHDNSTRQRSNSANKNKNGMSHNHIKKPIISSSKHRNNIEKASKQKYSTSSKEEIQLQKYYASKTFTFQNPLHDLVSSRVHDLASRVAFEQSRPPVTLTDLENAISKQLLGDIQSKNSSNGSKSKTREQS